MLLEISFNYLFLLFLISGEFGHAVVRFQQIICVVKAFAIYKDHV